VRIHPASDHHDDIPGNRVERLRDVDCDVIVIAGDCMQPGHHALRRIREIYPDRSKHLLYVPGNHDFYSLTDPKRPNAGTKTTIEAQRRDLMPRAADEEGIILLDEGEVELTNDSGDSVVFLGTTMWTDMRCSPSWMDRASVYRESEKRHNDYKLIKTGAGRSKDRITPGQTVAMHKQSLAWLTERLQAHVGRDVVVVTHFAPSPRSLNGYDPAKPGVFNNLDWLYASDLEHLMHGDAAPRVWLHGHIHVNRDYTVGDTRIVSNPRGYPELGRRENPHFDPSLVIDLEPRYLPTMRV
jgi:predicted phosphodiesterase